PRDRPSASDRPGSPDCPEEHARVRTGLPVNRRLYTPKLMDAAREGSELRSGRFDALHAEAKAALGYAGNILSGVRGRYREAFRDELARWQSMRDDVDAADMADPRDADPNGTNP